MKTCITILSVVSLLLFGTLTSNAQPDYSSITIDFFGNRLAVPVDTETHIGLTRPVSAASIHSFFQHVQQSDQHLLVNTLTDYAKKENLNDWLYYQLIRRTAQQLSPKAIDYERYTLYKYLLLDQSGFDVKLALSGNRLLLYVQSDDNIYDIPLFNHEGKQYVCLNIHDFDKFDLNEPGLVKVDIPSPVATRKFSYKISSIPDFTSNNYKEKELSFYYREKEYRYTVRLNPELNAMFANYPSVDFESYFNIPMSNLTYSSLIPLLKKKLRKMNIAKGVDYLMQFTRHAFPYEDDVEQFGKEKRLSPEQTLFYQYSDCDDRAALFFYLVKEIYNLPMIALMYPNHITIAVAFDKPFGKPVMYNGKAYTICEPTPQPDPLAMGQLPNRFRNQDYEVVYTYDPAP